MTDSNDGLFQQVNQLIDEAKQSAQNLLAQKGMQTLREVDNATANQIYQKLDGHAQSVINAGESWVRNSQPSLQQQLKQMGLLMTGLKATLSSYNPSIDDVVNDPNSIVLKLSTIETDIQTASTDVNGILAVVTTWNNDYVNIGRALHSDSETVKADINADKKAATLMSQKIANFNKEQSSAGHICGEVCKAMVSFGGWSIADAIKAQDHADSLYHQEHILRMDISALKHLKSPLHELLSKIGLLSDSIESLLATIQEMANAIDSPLKSAKSLKQSGLPNNESSIEWLDTLKMQLDALENETLNFISILNEI